MGSIQYLTAALWQGSHFASAASRRARRHVSRASATSRWPRSEADRSSARPGSAELLAAGFTYSSSTMSTIVGLVLVSAPPELRPAVAPHSHPAAFHARMEHPAAAVLGGKRDEVVEKSPKRLVGHLAGHRACVLSDTRASPAPARLTAVRPSSHTRGTGLRRYSTPGTGPLIGPCARGPYTLTETNGRGGDPL